VVYFGEKGHETFESLQGQCLVLVLVLVLVLGAGWLVVRDRGRSSRIGVRAGLLFEGGSPGRYSSEFRPFKDLWLFAGSWGESVFFLVWIP
jgi:hypothetical protein